MSPSADAHTPGQAALPSGAQQTLTILAALPDQQFAPPLDAIVGIAQGDVTIDRVQIEEELATFQQYGPLVRDPVQRIW